MTSIISSKSGKEQHCRDAYLSCLGTGDSNTEGKEKRNTEIDKESGKNVERRKEKRQK